MRPGPLDPSFQTGGDSGGGTTIAPSVVVVPPDRVKVDIGKNGGVKTEVKKTPTLEGLPDYPPGGPRRTFSLGLTISHCVKMNEK